MSREEDMKNHTRKVIEEIWNKGNLGLVDELFAGTYALHDPQNPMPIKSNQDYKQWAAGMRAAVPDLHITIDDMVAEKDRIAVRITFEGTQKGDLPGVPATGKYFSIGCLFIRRLQAGKAVEEWIYGDYLGWMQQLGVIPAQA